MTPKEFICKLSDLVESEDWDGVGGLHHSVTQWHVDSNAITQLESFYGDALELVFDPGWMGKIAILQTTDFEDAITNLFLESKSRMSKSDSIKAVYLEYFYDGGDASTADVFLCNRYSDDDDDWAAHFAKDNVLDGPGISVFFDYDPDFELAVLQDQIAGFYVDCKLLCATVRAWQLANLADVVLGFARHDARIIRVRHP